MAKAKKPDIVISHTSMTEIKPLNEELRKKLFPNVPPPTLRELKERKHKPKHDEEN